MSTKFTDQIAALLAKAESAKQIGELAEAETFMAAANRLLLKHNLSMHEVLMAAAEKNDEFAEWIYSEIIILNENQAGNRWKANLIRMIARHNMCGDIECSKYWEETNKKKGIRVYGDASNVDSVMWLYNFLHIRLLEMAKTARAALDPAVREEFCRHTYLKDYLIGAIDGIDAKIRADKKASEFKDAINAMILYNDEALERFVNATSKVEKVKSRSMNLGLGYSDGYSDGSKMSLGKKLNAAQQAVEKKLLK